MSVMVTGTGGMGSHIASRLVDEGVRCVMYGTGRQIEAMKDLMDIAKIDIFKGDILDREALSSAVKEANVERIIHTAGPRATQTRKDPRTGMRTHLLGTMNVLEVARAADLERVVFTSSASVYLGTKAGHEPLRPIKEDDPLVSMDHEDTYATTKVACEYQGFNYAKSYGFGFIALRMAHVYGPWSGDMGRGSSISNMVKNALLGKSVELDEQVAEWTHYNDLAEEHYLGVITKNVKIAAINAGSGKITSLGDVREVLGKYIKTDKITVKSKGQKSRRMPTDMNLARERLVHTPKYDVDRAVRELIEYWKPRLHLTV